MTENMTTAVSEEDAKLHQQQYAQLLHRLSKSGAHKVADRIEYLVSERNAEDGGDIPTMASIASFTTFFFNNRDLDEPFLGSTVNGELIRLTPFFLHGLFTKRIGSGFVS